MHQPMMVLWTATEVRAIRWIVVVGLFVVLVGAGHRRVIMPPTTRPAEQAESAAIDARLASLRQSLVVLWPSGSCSCGTSGPSVSDAFRILFGVHRSSGG